MGVGPRAAVEKALEAGGYAARAVRAPRRRRRRGDARARRSAHAPAVRRLARAGAGAAPARRRLPRDPRRGRRHPVDGGDDAGGVRGGPRPSRPALARRDARARRHHGRGEVRLRPRPRHRAAPDRRRVAARPRGPDRRRARRSSAPTPSRPSSGPSPDGTEAYVRQRHRGAAPGRRRARSRRLVRRVLRARRVLRRPEPPDPARRPPASGWRCACTPTSWPHRAARSSRPSSARCRPTTSTRRATRASRRSRAAGGEHPTVATLLPATTWFLMADEAAPARRFIDAGVPVALGTDFNPGTSPTPNLPLVMTVACLEMKLQPRGGARGRDDQRRARRGGGGPGGLDRARQAGGPRRVARARASPRSRTGSARTSSTSSSRAATSSTAGRLSRAAHAAHRLASMRTPAPSGARSAWLSGGQTAVGAAAAVRLRSCRATPAGRWSSRSAGSRS